MGWQDPQPDASVDRHVVDPKEIGRLVQAEMAGRVRGGQPASVPGNSCEASVEFTTRLNMGSALASTLADIHGSARRGWNDMVGAITT